MDFLKNINCNSKTFVIAEIGQNHQGKIETAKKLIEVAKESGADCVKFQKTCISEKFTKSALDVQYSGIHPWISTYGEHKASLEFSENQFLELQKYSKDLGIFFTASAMDPISLDFLVSIDVPFIKIGSGDSNNLILIEKAAKAKIPLVISTGMIGLESVKEIYNLVSSYHKNFALLHCVSAYPTPHTDIHLNVLKQFRQKFPDISIGYSGHELGTHISLCAVALGAEIIERHVTLDKSQIGSDHKCSLEPAEFKSLIDQIRSVEVAFGKPDKKVQESEKKCYDKLGKSLVYAEDLKKDTVMKIEDIKVKVSVPKGIDGLKYKEVLGRMLICDVLEDSPIDFEHFA